MRTLDKAAPAEIVGGVRNDPVFNRLSKLVERSVEQFDTVNPDRIVPNILAIVNHDALSGPDDLFETLTGTFPAAGGSRPPTMMNVAEGRIRDIKRRVDLYIWIEGVTGVPEGFGNRALLRDDAELGFRPRLQAVHQWPGLLLSDSAALIGRSGSTHSR